MIYPSSWDIKCDSCGKTNRSIPGLSQPEAIIEFKSIGWVFTRPIRNLVKTYCSNCNQSDCQWFHGCKNKATGAADHPVLGSVPICQRCASRAGVDFNV